MDIQRAEHGHDDEVGQDEGPAAGPGAPEASADVRDPDAHLDGEGPREGLADRDPLAHLLFGEPLPLGHQLALHLPDERDGAAEAEETEA